MRFPPSGADSRRPLRRLTVLTRWAILATACLTVLSSGVAQAAPPKSPLLKTGKLATTSCPEPPIIDLGIPRTREYLTTVMKCLDKSWSAHFARAGLRFRKPTVRFYEEPAQKVCGTVPWPVNVGALYCTERATLVFPLTGDWIENRTDLYPFKIAAHEYGHHLQSLTGVRRDYEARVRSDPAHQNELNRRYELQADCLSGVFLGSVRRSLPRTAQDWESLSDELRASGDDPGHRTHGAGANRVRWFDRGYRAISPAACDTWTAKPSYVS
ncbi:neutral zinc metallopeptidase [Streptosporangium lutulentum]|uniref:Metalloprotease n=1 Tax=Streptosporangium lutulentum TaxID=1461250 RepID=A0ABT9QNV3_9ACTN|nr:neutral zinc metallopeptidase [Streptosporangium lutulentum]MDP9847599.1 putative metalloprotease [Streptosporangium lutulentum]